eukprot:6189474-Amphidinium_carterae.1
MGERRLGLEIEEVGTVKPQAEPAFRSGSVHEHAAKCRCSGVLVPFYQFADRSHYLKTKEWDGTSLTPCLSLSLKLLNCSSE